MRMIERIREKKQIVRAVIYARFSSDNQREESIDAQLRTIHVYAKKNSVIVVGEYKNKAKSAMTDNRPEFMQMISDSARSDFDLVLVHKLDRFARNRPDSVSYGKLFTCICGKVLAVYTMFGKWFDFDAFQISPRLREQERCN